MQSIEVVLAAEGPTLIPLGGWQQLFYWIYRLEESEGKQIDQPKKECFLGCREKEVEWLPVHPHVGGIAYVGIAQGTRWKVKWVTCVTSLTWLVAIC